ncbi:MAG: hypothetical protein CM1200mP30_21730 [Pseudomonadota bacterium]|nr:MAG: hypothetical protein CM1200mP30_21730 [Pseudomonadota bacterium]
MTVHLKKKAERAATFIFKNLKDESGRLLRRWCDGEARYPAYLCDYAQMTMACLDLYETTYDPVWFQKGCELSNGKKTTFSKWKKAPFFDTGIDGEVLLHAMRKVLMALNHLETVVLQMCL